MSSVKRNKTILFITPYPINIAPGQRFRFEQYLDLLKRNKLDFDFTPFLDEKTNNILYKKGGTLKKTYGVFKGFLNRLFLLTKIKKYDFIFIFREASPIGPPIIEWIIFKLFNKKIIYDYDDAIWLEDPIEKGSLKSKIKYKSKISSICRWSYKISAGNIYLAQFAKQFNANVIVNPTTIDTVGLHNPKLYEQSYQNKTSSLGRDLDQNENVDDYENIFSEASNDLSKPRPVIGWTGTHSTLQYLELIIPILLELEKKQEFTFLVIANENPNFKLKSFRFIPWSKETEIVDLMKIDIGIMPLSDDAWSQGKCGFKLLQYLSLEKPTLASPIGVNTSIIDDGVNGYLCQTNQDWMTYLELLLNDATQRTRLGQSGRKKVVEEFSVLSNQNNFLSLFE